MEDKVIQTIVMRAKFPDKDGNLRKIRVGKYIAQACHASVSVLSNKFRNGRAVESLSVEEAIWVEQAFTKICLYVDTEDELLDVYNKAKNEGLCVSLIRDAGHTEFGGIPTYTCLAIGPHWKSKIDKITKDLKLF